MKIKAIAAVDIGSNSILLTIVKAKAGLEKFEILHDEAVVTGLAKGLHSGAHIAEDRAAKSEQVFRNFRKTLEAYDLQYFKAAGTESFRKAKNGDEVKRRFEEALGTSIEIISGNREAELSFRSVDEDPLFSNFEKQKVVFDIGGASSEVCIGRAGKIKQKISLKIGSVLLTEKYELDQSKKSAEAAIQEVEKMIADQIPWKPEAAAGLGFGVAGTITTLSALELKLSTYDRKKIHGHHLSRKRVESWLLKLLSEEIYERAQNPGLTQDRADILPGGLAILMAFFRAFDWNEIVCADSGVRFGLIYEALEKL